MNVLSDDVPVQSSPVPVQSDSLPDPPSLSLVRTKPFDGISARMGRGELICVVWECVDIMYFMPSNNRNACCPVK